MKYLIYLRVSKEEQDLRTQLDHCMIFIKQRDKTDFKYEIYKDEISSKKPLSKREGGKKLLENIRDGDIVIAMRLDRLSRKLHETTLLIDVLDKKKAEIFLVQQPGINNKILLGLYAGMAEEEVKLLRKRVSEKLNTKRRNGERYSGQLPYGYTMHETHMVPIKLGKEIVYKRGVLIPIDREQLAINHMNELSSIGLSYHAIAKELDRLGFKNREGRPFQKMTIYRILSRTKNAIENQKFQTNLESVAFR